MDDRLPLPAAAYGQGPFVIINSNDSSGAVVTPKDGQPGVLKVPLDNKESSIAVRAHEYGHLILARKGILDKKLIETAIKENISFEWLQATIDVVVNSFLSSCGVDIKNLPFKYDTAPDISTVQKALIFIRSAFLAIEKTVRDDIETSIDADDLKLLKEADQQLRTMGERAKPNHSNLVDIMKRLEQRFKPNKFIDPDTQKRQTTRQRVNKNTLDLLLAGFKVSPESFFEVTGSDEKSSKSKKTSDVQDEQEDTRESSGDKLPLYTLLISPKSKLKMYSPNLSSESLNRRIGKNMERFARSKFKFLINTEVNSWGKMIIETIPLSRVVPVARNAFKPKPNMVGALRYPHRALPLVSDGQAFANKKRSKGGTILLDTSGSMCLSLDDIERLIKAFPMATIACYSGCFKTRHDIGRLSIVAKNGRMISEKNLTLWYRDNNGDNIVDGPALEWLGRQDRPRIWISDGQVTGINDICAENLTAEAKLITKKFRITNLQNIPECLEKFRHNRLTEEEVPQK